MQLTRRTTLAAAGAAAAAAVAVPVAAHAATSSDPVPGSNSAGCATSSQFQQVQHGQTVAQVQQEMGSSGTVTDSTVKEGTRTLEIQWRSCGLLGTIQYGVDFHANAGGPLLVLGKSALPPTRLG